MPSSQLTSWELVTTGAAMLLTGLLGMAGYFGRRQVQRLDEIAQSYISRDEFDQKLGQLRGEIQQVRGEVKDGAQSTHKRLDQLMLIMAGDKGRG